MSIWKRNWFGITISKRSSRLLVRSDADNLFGASYLLYFLQTSTQSIEWNVSHSLSDVYCLLITDSDCTGIRNHEDTIPLNLTAFTRPLSSKNHFFSVSEFSSTLLYRLFSFKNVFDSTVSAGKNTYKRVVSLFFDTRQLYQNIFATTRLSRPATVFNSGSFTIVAT